MRLLATCLQTSVNLNTSQITLLKTYISDTVKPIPFPLRTLIVIAFIPLSWQIKLAQFVVTLVSASGVLPHLVRVQYIIHFDVKTSNKSLNVGGMHEKV